MLAWDIKAIKRKMALVEVSKLAQRGYCEGPHKLKSAAVMLQATGFLVHMAKLAKHECQVLASCPQVLLS